MISNQQGQAEVKSKHYFDSAVMNAVFKEIEKDSLFSLKLPEYCLVYMQHKTERVITILERDAYHYIDCLDRKGYYADWYSYQSALDYLRSEEFDNVVRENL